MTLIYIFQLENMESTLETKESSLNQKILVEEQVSKEKKFYKSNFFPHINKFDFNPNLAIKHKKQNQTNNFFPNFLSKEAIFNSFLNQQKTVILQRLLKETNIETIEFIVNELRGAYSDIIKDKNGNYFCSDLIKVCDQNNRIKILEELSPTISKDCSNYYASHTIQVFIGKASSEIEYKYILNSFSNYNNFLAACLNPKGCYTIQKIIACIHSKLRNDFNFIFASFIDLISKEKFGIVVIKKFIEKTKDENIISLIMNFIRKNFIDIAVNQYANYLIQFLLEEWSNTPEGNEIKEIVFENFQEMCKKKYSSFICELFIKIISTEEKMNLIKTLDLDYLLKSNNRHVIKIMTALGIFENANKNHKKHCNINKDDSNDNTF